MKNNAQKNKMYNELLNKYGSPLYIYDEKILKNRCQQILDFKKNLETKLEGVKVNMHYSTKANNNPAILKIVKKYELCVDCMSLFELYINQKSGFTNDEILYVCNNIDEQEMRIVHETGVLICLDSISQVETWGKKFPNTDIMIRINPGIEGIGHSKKVITSGKETKFGINEENFNKLFDIVNRYNLEIIGIHQHLGSLFLNDKIDDYINGVKRGLYLVNKYNEFNNIKIFDLGGGFGVPYKNEEPLDFSRVEEQLIDILRPFSETHKLLEEYKFEPGRFIPCEAGSIIGKVNAVKFENNGYWIGTDIGMNQLVRPSMYDAYHKIDILSTNGNKKIKANICGNICESGDILAKNREVDLPNIGDIVLVHNAGAYGYSMASNYTGRLRPAEVMISDGKYKLIRKRETIEFLESNIVWY